MEKSWQCNGCCKGSYIDGVDMVVEAKWDSYLERQRDFDRANERKSGAINQNVIFVVWMQFLLNKTVSLNRFFL